MAVLWLPQELATTSTQLVVTPRLRRSKLKVRRSRSARSTAYMFSADASKLSAKVKSEAPGREKEAEKKGQELAQRASSSFDKAVSRKILHPNIRADINRLLTLSPPFRTLRRKHRNSSRRAPRRPTRPSTSSTRRSQRRHLKPRAVSVAGLVASSGICQLTGRHDWTEE